MKAFGLAAALLGSPHPLTVVAASPGCTVLLAPSTAFYAAVKMSGLKFAREMLTRRGGYAGGDAKGEARGRRGLLTAEGGFEHRQGGGGEGEGGNAFERSPARGTPNHASHFPGGTPNYASQQTPFHEFASGTPSNYASPHAATQWGVGRGASSSSTSSSRSAGWGGRGRGGAGSGVGFAELQTGMERFVKRSRKAHR